MTADDSKRDEEQRLAENRLRAEMARARRQEVAEMKAVKIGCSTIIAVMLIAMVVMFFL